MSTLDVVETTAEAEAQERPPLIVREPLQEFLDHHDLGAGDIEAEPIGEGHSNVTYLIRRDDDRFVLRRPPRPPVPPSANDVLRESRLLQALQATDVPTADVLAVCEDESVIGAPFYVMPFLEGHVITTEMPDELDNPAERRRTAFELVDALVQVHAVDWHACGLDTFAKHSGYLERQVKRFMGLWEFSKTRELPAVQEVGEWLQVNLPDTPQTTIVHGDYRLGNTMFEVEAPARLKAIFDWEMATLGDPLADLGYMTATWSRPNEGFETTFDLTTVTHAEGFPDRDELVERYAEQSGRSLSDLKWYQALAIWKATVFMEGNYKRAMLGASDDPYLKAFGESVPQLAGAAKRITQS
ncbi:MAG TPA: phosphotransferase family protein [Thermoleophilaceae bacterium]|nr:phosphotransferase family protein [Thermoleophilaceae bacterium]